MADHPRRRDGAPLDPQAVDACFRAGAPWVSRFTIDDRHYGGDLPVDVDGRPEEFFSHAGRPGTILELGALEGGHTIRLAAPPFVRRVVALEGREESVARARLVVDLLGYDHVEVRAADLEQADLRGEGRFDAVYCVGLLYHLTRPWSLLEQIAAVTDLVWIDTHYSASGPIRLRGYRGRMYRELGRADAQSGLRPGSFWPTRPALHRMLEDVGLHVDTALDDPDCEGGPRIRLLCRR